MNRFFFPAPFAPKQEVTLSPEDSHHLAQVLRMAEGEKIELFDGKGQRASAQIIKSDRKKTSVLIETVEQVPQKWKVAVAFGISKPLAMEFIFRRCTELGVRKFIPLITERSLRMGSWNSERWGKIVIEVAKQCQESYLPEVSEPISLAHWLTERSRTEPLILCSETNRKADEMVPGSGPLDLLIGPEGGWSPSEQALAIGHGAMLLGLGDNRLRTEMAALTGVVLLKSYVGEF